MGPTFRGLYQKAKEQVPQFDPTGRKKYRRDGFYWGNTFVGKLRIPRHRGRTVQGEMPSKIERRMIFPGGAGIGGGRPI